MPIFQTGAFLQQCFAVHPLSLSFKMVTLPDKVGILCTNCNMRHRLTATTLHTHRKEETLSDRDGSLQLKQCAESHSEDMRVSGVNVERDAVEIRCRKCQRSYQITVARFETYQP